MFQHLGVQSSHTRCDIIIFQTLLKSSLQPQEMSTLLPKPLLNKKTQVCQENTFTASLCQMQGWRKTMEDALVFKTIKNDNSEEEVKLFAVCDGHGGPQVAALVAKLLPEFLTKDAEFKKKNFGKALTNVFKKLDEYLCTSKGEEELKKLNKSLKGPELKVNEKLFNKAGTTLNVLLLTKDKYIVANAGDSRCVLSRSHKAVPLSSDHKPENPIQKDRIESAGGYVHNGRVNGLLALSRSLGDFQFKHFSQRSYEEQAVTSLPSIIQVPRDAKEDNFILMACDGIWERYPQENNQKLIDNVKMLRSRYNDKDVLQKLWDQLVSKNGKEVYGCDNMSGILIEFK